MSEKKQNNQLGVCVVCQTMRYIESDKKCKQCLYIEQNADILFDRAPMLSPYEMRSKIRELDTQNKSLLLQLAQKPVTHRGVNQSRIDELIKQAINIEKKLSDFEPDFDSGGYFTAETERKFDSLKSELYGLYARIGELTVGQSI